MNTDSYPTLSTNSNIVVSIIVDVTNTLHLIAA